MCAYLKQFSVRYEAVVVHVVDAEREPQLGQLVALHAELRHALDELLEVHLQHRHDVLTTNSNVTVQTMPFK